MALENWPSGVPYMTQENGFQLTPFNLPDATDMDSGEQLRRRRKTGRIALQKATIKMTESQYATFISWAETNLIDATQEFNAPVFKANDAGDMGYSAGYVVRQCAFDKGQITAAPEGGVYWNVSFTFRIRNL
jgi:hypothetical protein